MTKRDKDKRVLKYADAKAIAEKQQRSYEPTSIKLPKGVQLYSFQKEGLHELDVMPFVAKAGNPNSDEGFITWERTYYVHPSVGPDNRKYVCAWENFRKRCPVCDEIAKMSRGGTDAETIRALKKLGRRQLIRVKDKKELDKGIQLYEGPYYNGLGELLDKKVDGSKEGSSIRKFYHLEGGKTLCVNVKKELFKGHPFFKPTNVEMEDRGELSESVLDEGPHPDDLVKVVDYEALKQIFLQSSSPSDNGHSEEKPPRNEKDVDEDEEELDDDELEDEDEEEEPVLARSKKPPVKDDEDDDDIPF